MANVLQHIESGCCTGTSGIENARQEIYDQADNMFGLQYVDGYQPYDTPEYPYECPECYRTFREGSQCLQHQEHKHDLDPRNSSY
jgi:hypothetical protein